jgi:exodeoxyribonuclease VII small subunit
MNKKAVTFEDAIDGLEKVVEQLERDDLTLDKALEHFEKGIQYIRVCDEQLKRADGTLKELLKGENGEFIEKIIGAKLDSAFDQPDENG